ncbi:MAG: hypothetical protein ACXADW_21020 [Candidatus Hodarchaeales archaeon]|jgi:hypothetical protein
MFDLYGAKEVARFESNNFTVSTAKVFDGPLPFETGISHLDYKNGKFIIVELYNNIKEAKEGHKKWVKKMRTLPLNQIAQFKNSFTGWIHNN